MFTPETAVSEAVCILALDGGTTTLRFVDLAGSERNYETRSMTAQQHRDFAEINKSLMALKEMQWINFSFWGGPFWHCGIWGDGVIFSFGTLRLISPALQPNSDDILQN
jgi:hypothetical protein